MAIQQLRLTTAIRGAGSTCFSRVEAARSGSGRHDQKHRSHQSQFFKRFREIFCEIDHPVRGKLTIPGWPVKMSDSYVKVTSSPILGADDVTIYGDWLGLSKGDVDKLKAEGVV